MLSRSLVLLLVSPSLSLSLEGRREKNMAKKDAAPELVLLGRPSTHLKMGIVGMPNVGKSTLFNILTRMNIPAENFPFCTIDPNENTYLPRPLRRATIIDPTTKS
mgnify:CR=1 FL=1